MTTPRTTQAVRKPARRAAPAPRPARDDVDAALMAMGGHCICGNLRMAARLVTAYYDAALRPVGIEANQMIMLWVMYVRDAMAASEVAHTAGMDQSTASRNLAVLEARGLVAATVAADDRRQRLLRLTPRGRAVLVRAYPRWRKAQDEVTALAADLTDLPSVGRVLRKVTRRMQAR
jgi:DNA-binding MarR family transcriptional regulator